MQASSEAGTWVATKSSNRESTWECSDIYSYLGGGKWREMWRALIGIVQSHLLYLCLYICWEILFILIPLLQLGDCVWIEKLIGKDIGLWVSRLEKKENYGRIWPSL